jgi:hypothetical protein
VLNKDELQGYTSHVLAGHSGWQSCFAIAQQDEIGIMGSAKHSDPEYRQQQDMALPEVQTRIGRYRQF